MVISNGVKERPILFSGEMVRAILEGRKTMTRRVMRIQPKYHPKWKSWELAQIVKGQSFDWPEDMSAPFGISGFCPYGIPGDRLWVRETWAQGQRNGKDTVLFYKASHEKEVAEGIKWKPSIFMPRWASRIMLENTNIRVERLQEITASDVEREGAITKNTDIRDALGIWIKLWDSINGKKYPWASNPWVWVIEFTQLKAKNF